MDIVSTKCSYNVKNYKPVTDIVQLEVVENWDIMHNVLQRRKPRQILSIVTSVQTYRSSMPLNHTSHFININFPDGKQKK